MHPSIDCLLLSPLCSMTLSSRPLVLPGNCTISLKVGLLMVCIDCLVLSPRVGFRDLVLCVAGYSRRLLPRGQVLVRYQAGPGRHHSAGDSCNAWCPSMLCSLVWRFLPCAQSPFPLPCFTRHGATHDWVHDLGEPNRVLIAGVLSRVPVALRAVPRRFAADVRASSARASDRRGPRHAHGRRHGATARRSRVRCALLRSFFFLFTDGCGCAVICGHWLSHSRCSLGRQCAGEETLPTGTIRRGQHPSKHIDEGVVIGAGAAGAAGAAGGPAAAAATGKQPQGPAADAADCK